MDILAFIAAIVVGLIGFDLAALNRGVDSRESDLTGKFRSPHH